MMPLHYVCGYFLRACASLYSKVLCVIACHLCVLRKRACIEERCMCARHHGRRAPGGQAVGSTKTKCRDLGSNWGPSDIRSDAPPTELSRLDQMVTPVLVFRE